MNIKFPAFEAINLKNDAAMSGILELPLAYVFPNLNQPRKMFDEQALNELADSIKQYGIIQPIIVRMVNEKNYEIIAGERRWRASGIAGLRKIPAIVQKNDAQANIAISIIENIQREQLNPIELAEAFYKLSHDHLLSHEAIAHMVGKNRSTVSNLLRLLNLPPKVKELLMSSKLEMGHAKALITLSFDQQVSLATKIVEKNLSVRETERLAQLHKIPQQKIEHSNNALVDKWVERFSKKLSTKVSVKINEKGEGRVVIHFASPSEVDWLLEQLENI